MKMETKYTFIGGGNMAEGIIRGMVQEFQPQQIHVYDIAANRVDFLAKEYGVVGEHSLEDAGKGANVMFFCIQPYAAQEVARQVKPFLSKDCVFVPVCTGVTLATFEGVFGTDQKIIRIMPNTLTQTHHGVSAMCRNANVTEEDAQKVTAALNAIGSTVEIQENLFNAFTAYSCTGPCYLYVVINALIDAGVRAGFTRAEARQMTIENVLGSALKLEMSGLHPYQIMDTMSCPAGTGIEAIYTMEKEGVYGSVMHAVERTCIRANEIG